MAQSAISLCAHALIKVGAKSIASFNENTAEAEVALHLYQTTRDGLLSAYPWRFATTQQKLVRLAANPFADYEYAFLLPQDFLRAISAGEGSTGRGLDYRIHQNMIHTNSKEVMLTYIFRPDEINFPAFFDELLIVKLASAFCLPLTESTTRTEFLEKQAEKLFTHAKLVDAQQAHSQTITDYPLIGVRG